jgi:Uma2 family endonuclease
LSNPTALPLTKLTPEQYLAIEREAEYKSEYFNGEMYAMAGSSRAHSKLSMRLARILMDHLDGSECEVYGSDMKVCTDPKGLHAYPDVTVACGEQSDDQSDVLTKPRVIIEVLSKSTEATDRGFKFHQYQEIATLVEYVLVSQSEPLIERFWRAPEGEWSGYSKTHGLEATLKVGSLNVEIPLAEIYRGVEFEGTG